MGSVTIDIFCSLIFILLIKEIQLCKVIAHFPAQFAPMIFPLLELEAVYWRETTGKMCINFAQRCLGKGKINEQNKSINSDKYMPNLKHIECSYLK